MNKRGLLLIAGITLFYIVNNFIYLSLNKYPCEGDEPSHLYIALYYRNLILHPFPNFEGRLYKILEWQWPPFHHIFSALISFIFGVSYLKLVMVNIVYLVILLIGVYFSSRKIYNQKAAIFSVFLISVYPFIFGYSRIFMLDFPLTAIVALSMSLLLYTERFSNRKFSILFAISMGVGLVIKWTYIIFITGPLLYVVLQGIYESLKERKKLSQLVINLLLAGGFAFIISTPWYLWANGRHLKQIFSFWHIANVIPQDEINPHSVSLWESRYLWYLVSLINHQVSFVYFVVFLLVLPLFLMDNKVKSKLTFILWIIIPYVFLSHISFKQQRFLVPVLPAIAIISGSGLSMVRTCKVRRLIVVLLSIIGIIQYFLLSYTEVFMSKNFVLPSPFHYLNILPTPVVVETYGEDEKITVCGAPLVKGWALLPLLRIIRNYYEQEGYPPLFVGVISEITTFYRKTLWKYSNALYYNDFSDEIRFYNIAPYTVPRFVREFFKNSGAFNVVIFISKNSIFSDVVENIDREFNLPPREKKIFTNLVKKVLNEYTLWNTISLPDSFRCYIYVKKIPQLQKYDWKVFLHNGILKLNYEGFDLIEGEGLYLSCFIDARHHLSEDCRWEEETVREDCISIQGYTSSEIGEYWVARIVDKNKIKVESYLDIFSPRNIKEILCGIFLSDDYFRWYDSRNKGRLFRKQMLTPCLENIRVNGKKEVIPLKIKFFVQNSLTKNIVIRHVEYYNFVGLDNLGQEVYLLPGRYKILDITIKTIPSSF